ncbi:hypothetical protein CI109_105817 [Kwoniella shandongensis]|uniref:Uncharacterized protein n=1 Tax=Kwoniella shandongensis TaxID=1734106 RepID=A0A5M6C0W5_9TREE|nr:uncharacterized protein CI109_003156 [Kwoniella shandongensis]KAA5528624.1 hypothetical protein CI109_003156 [Kwoniella shandongensis]
MNRPTSFRAHSDMHSAPSTTPTSPTSANQPSSHAESSLSQRYPRVFNENASHSNNASHSASTRSIRPRGLSPLTPAVDSAQNHGNHLPKSQPLSRALFARKADTPHAGTPSGGSKKGLSQKIIVPTKSFRTTFELDLSSSELARRA